MSEERYLDIEAVMDLSDIITSLQDLDDDSFTERGLSVAGTWDEVDDPILIGPDGTPVDTWREGYPYEARMSRREYEMTKRLLQIELLKMQGLRLTGWNLDGILPDGMVLRIIPTGREAELRGATSGDRSLANRGASWSRGSGPDGERQHDCSRQSPGSRSTGSHVRYSYQHPAQTSPGGPVPSGRIVSPGRAKLPADPRLTFASVRPSSRRSERYLILRK
jgi:hypothetical protein